MNNDLDIRQKQFKKLIERKIGLKVKQQQLKATWVNYQDHDLVTKIDDDNEYIDKKSRKINERDRNVRRNWLREFELFNLCLSNFELVQFFRRKINWRRG